MWKYILKSAWYRKCPFQSLAFLKTWRKWKQYVPNEPFCAGCGDIDEHGRTVVSGSGRALVAAQLEMGVCTSGAAWDRPGRGDPAGLELGCSPHLRILAQPSPKSPGKNGKRNTAFQLLRRCCGGVLTHQGKPKETLKDLATDFSEGGNK